MHATPAYGNSALSTTRQSASPRHNRIPTSVIRCLRSPGLTPESNPRHRYHPTHSNLNTAMSRHSVAPARSLSLTEELERLEQSITLTLQGTSNATGFATPKMLISRRDRLELQQSASHCYVQHPPYRRTIRAAFARCMGRLQGKVELPIKPTGRG